MVNCEKCGNDIDECTCDKPTVTMTPAEYETVRQKVLDSTKEVKSDSEIAEDVKAHLVERLGDYGISINASDIRSSADMERWIAVLKQLKEKDLLAESNAPSGSAPLNPTVGGEMRREVLQGFNQGFSDVKEMLKFLRAKENSPIQSERDTAKRILDEFFRKYLRLKEKGEEQLKYGIPEDERENIKERE